jgi:hypothetical protein
MQLFLISYDKPHKKNSDCHTLILGDANFEKVRS